MFSGARRLRHLPGNKALAITKAAVGCGSPVKRRKDGDKAPVMLKLGAILMVSHDHLKPSLGRWC